LLHGVNVNFMAMCASVVACL